MRGRVEPCLAPHLTLPGVAESDTPWAGWGGAGCWAGWSPALRPPSRAPWPAPCSLDGGRLTRYTWTLPDEMRCAQVLPATLATPRPQLSTSSSLPPPHLPISSPLNLLIPSPSRLPSLSLSLFAFVPPHLPTSSAPYILTSTPPHPPSPHLINLKTPVRKTSSQGSKMR